MEEIIIKMYFENKMKQVDIEQQYLFSDINVIKKNEASINIDTSTLNY